MDSAIFRTTAPPLWNRTLSRLVAAYPVARGQTRLRSKTSPWLVGHAPGGAWARVSGIVDAEWKLLHTQKDDPTSAIIRSILRPGSTFVDIGANIGCYTLLACSLGARVIAYEPTPTVFERLRENLALNGFRNATIVNSAVTEHAGMLTFYGSPDDPEANNLFCDGQPSMQVPTVALDQDLPARGIQTVDLLKIDAEGAEPLILDGASGLLASPSAPSILIEVNGFALKNAGFTPADIFDRLHAYGYTCTEFESAPYNNEIMRNVLATRPALGRA